MIMDILNMYWFCEPSVFLDYFSYVVFLPFILK